MTSADQTLDIRDDKLNLPDGVVTNNITSLLRVELIARGIFKNVDCFGLLSARSISPTWQEAVDRTRVWKIVLDQDVKWKKMYKILIKKGMESEPTENDNYPDFYAQLYGNIKKNLMRLENNWILKSTYQRVIKFSYFGHVQHLNFKVRANEQFVVVRKHSHAVELYNRWTMTSEHVFDIGPDSQVMIKCAEVANNYIAVGCNRGRIFVWCLKTREMLHKLVDDPALLASESFAQSVMASRVDCSHIRFDPTERKLLSCITNIGCQYETLTLRKILSPQEMTITHQETIHQFNALQVQIDSCFVYLLGANNKGILILSASTLELVNTIAETMPSVKSFQPYNNSIIVAGREEISVWNPNDGVCIRQFRMNPADGYLKTIGLVGDKYIISCHVVCWSADFYALRINVWDLQSAIEASQEQTTKPLHSFDVTTHSWHDRNVDGVRDTLVDKLRVFIDDYQIRCLITWKYDFERRETPVPMLYFLNFLNPLKEPTFRN